MACLRCERRISACAATSDFKGFVFDESPYHIESIAQPHMESADGSHFFLTIRLIHLKAGAALIFPRRCATFDASRISCMKGLTK
jgi:hypothetical protein